MCCHISDIEEIEMRMNKRQDSDVVAELLHPNEGYLQQTVETLVQLLNGYNQVHILHYGENSPGYTDLRNCFVDMRRDLENKIQLRRNREFIATMDGGRIVR